MVATSLPFWMHHSSRAMLPFTAEETARPSSVRSPTGRGPVAGLAEGLVVERCSAAQIEAHADAWAALAARTLEPNVFMEPGFALPAIRHFAPSHLPAFLLCWSRNAAGEPALIGLLALQNRRQPLRVPAAMAWHNPQWVTCAPLLDRDRAAEAIDALLATLATRRGDRGGLMLRGMMLDGPTMHMLAADGQRRIAVLDQRTRAVLPRDHGATSLDAKRAKELRRQRRRLADGADCVVRSARTVEEIRVATERFLELEARGWKGRRGTALLSTPRLATFVRAMTRLMARQGLCRIDALEVGGQAVAMGIVLRSGDRAYFWKTAFDETRRRQSPGKQLAEALSALQQADAAVALTDSCAIPDHPMIDRLWKDRVMVADVIVAGPANGEAWVACARAALRLGQAGRQAAKRFVHGIRARLRRR